MENFCQVIAGPESSDVFLNCLQKEERVWPPSQNSAQYERVVEL